MEDFSITGALSSIISVTVWDIFEYNSMSPFTTFACGHNLNAIRIGIADRTPNFLAS
jgi:hypothetical protein